MTEIRVYLDLNKKTFDNTSKRAIERAVEEGVGEERFLHPGLSISVEGIDELSFVGDELTISGTLWTPETENLGYLSVHIPVSTEIALEIIQAYIKKFNKIKTVLEATT